MRSRTPEGRLAALIAGDGSGRALTLALETGRLLSAKSPTLLVDLGATQGWFGDILEREETELGRGLRPRRSARGPGELRRDHSSRSLVATRVIPAGGDATGGSLEDVFAALMSAYDCVVFHASDWRSTRARAAADSTDAVVLVAPTARLRRVVEEARESLGDGARIFPFAVMRPQSTLEEVA